MAWEDYDDALKTAKGSAAFTAVSSATVATPFICSTPKETIWNCIFLAPAAGASAKRTDGNRRIYFTTKDAKSTKFRDENYSDLRALRAFVVNPTFSFWLHTAAAFVVNAPTQSSRKIH